jgi:pyruvate,water dikinase
MPKAKSKKEKYLLWFSEIEKNDLAFVGGKGANLGEMTKVGLPVPNGFVVTVKAYFEFLEKNNLREPIKKILAEIKSGDPASFRKAATKIKKLIKKGEIPKEIALQIMKAYLKLGGKLKNVLVAVRSSATAEDLPTASFAGQQATFLNVRGEASVVDNVRACWASLFEPRAIFYRQEQGFDHFKVGIAVPVQEMIQSDISGVMFTTDPITNEKNKILIEAIFGLGELIVRGEVIPDRYLVERQSLKILSKNIGKQAIQLIKVKNQTKRKKVSARVGAKQKLTDEKIKELARLGKKIHQHYYFPQDIEWAQKAKKLYILQTRPITTLDKKAKSQKKRPSKIDLPLILEGESASPGLVVGPVKIVRTAKNIGLVKKGDILVTPMTTPDFVPAMKKVAAIVTDFGGQTSHAAIVSRELGVPCIIGAKKATRLLKNKLIVTVDAQKGRVYKGAPKWQGKEFKPAQTFAPISDRPIVKTATKLYVNLGQPEKAQEVAQKNVDGVGLLRAEFMIAQIGTHPKKIIQDRKQKKFITTLSENLKIFCEAFSPRPIIYRATDFKTNEYRNLTGGSRFEPEEENPMLGFRGAFRYLTDPSVFELELAAILKVRNKFRLKNLWLMIPFVRTPAELVAVKKIVAGSGLIRSPSFKLWLMVEVPSNVILLDKFIDAGIDGVSIGSNDLTMLILGADRDNQELKDVFDERHPAVLWALKRTIEICHKRGVTSSICGQAPSFYSSLTEKLVEWGITSISVAPDRIDATRELIYSLESRLIKKRARK